MVLKSNLVVFRSIRGYLEAHGTWPLHIPRLITLQAGVTYMRPVRGDASRVINSVITSYQVPGASKYQLHRGLNSYNSMVLYS